jgi:glucose/mannose-6-phosphate isomerase
VINVTETEYNQALQIIADVHLACGVNQAQEANPAKLLAFEMKELLPVIVAAEHLEGNAHVFANQLNENSKTYSEFRVIPEMNHHLMEGLQFPEANEHNLFFFMVESDLYAPSIRRRFELTQEVLEKHTIRVKAHKLSGKTPFEQSFELLVFGAYTNYYLAMLNNVNPAPIPTVDWFKSQLKK